MSKPKFFTLKPKVSSKEMVCIFPREISDYLNQSKDSPVELYYLLVNGILQISAHKPVATIPMLRKDEFVPQS